MKIIAFGASSSKASINKQLATYAANQFDGDIKVLDLNDFPIPIYSIDEETDNGIPENAQAFYNELQSADLIVISLAEHNGSYTAVFKNLLDWNSRIEGNCFHEKKLFLLATSPGGRGGETVLNSALERFPRHGATILGSFSLPSFQDNFNTEQGIHNSALKAKFDDIVKNVKTKLF